jgi:hypothetical protein
MNSRDLQMKQHRDQTDFSRREALALGVGALLGPQLAGLRAAAAAAADGGFPGVNVAYAGEGALVRPSGTPLPRGPLRLRAFPAGGGPAVLDRSHDPAVPVPIPAAPGEALRYAIGEAGTPLSPLVRAARAAHIGILASRSDGMVGQGVHFALNEADLAGPATDLGLSVPDFMRRAICMWRFSKDPAEDYPFSRLRADKYGRRTAGGALGPFAAHVYESLGRHEVSCVISLGDAIWRAQTEVSINRTRDQAYGHATALCDPQGDFSGYDGAALPLTFADPDEALTWLQQVPGRRLMLRRGRSYEIAGELSGASHSRGYWLVDRSCLEAWGDGPAPILRPGRDWRTFTPAIDMVGDGRAAVFDAPAKGKIRREIIAYVNGCRRHDAVAQGKRVTFASPPPPGAQVLVFEASHRGGLPQKGTFLLSVAGAEVIVRGIDFRGGYDAANPGVFDGATLASFEHSVNTSALFFKSSTADRCTLFDCSGAGLRDFVACAYAGDADIIANCAVTDWSNYGIYLNDARRLGIVGCDISQNESAANSSGGSRKSENAIGLANEADHGPVRTPESYFQVVNACRFGSYNSWAAKDWQPVLRMATTDAEGMSYCLTESDCWGGAAYISGGPPNLWVPFRRQGLIWSGGNRFVAGLFTKRLSGGVIPFASHGDLLVIADSGATERFDMVSGDDLDEGVGPDGYVATSDVDLSPPLIANMTVVALGDRPDAELILSRPTVIQGIGLLCRIGETEVDRDAAEIRIEIDAVSPFVSPAWHLWLQPAGRPIAEATAYPDRAAQHAAYTFSHETRDVKAGDFLTVRRRDGVFSAGDRLILTRTPLDRDDETFLRNNRTEPLIRAAPEYHDLLLLVEGAWKGVEMALDAPPVAADTFRAARYGAFDALWRPQAGNSALGAGSPRADAIDGAGWIRPSPPAIGALERFSDPDARPVPATPAIAAPRGGWTRGALVANRPLSAAAVQVDPVGSGPSPQVLFALRRDGVGGPLATAPAPAPGDLVMAEITRHSPLTGRLSHRLPYRRVPGGDRALSWIRSAPGTGLFWRSSDAAEPPAGEGLHFACRLHARPRPGKSAVLCHADALSIEINAAGEVVVFAAGAKARFAFADGRAHSLLVSVMPGARAAGGGLECRVDSAPVAVGDAGTPRGQRSVRLLSEGQGSDALDADIRQWIGLWIGARPGWDAFFGPDHEPRDVLLNPDLSGKGTRALALYDGLESFNEPYNLAGGSGDTKLFGDGFAVV